MVKTLLDALEPIELGLQGLPRLICLNIKLFQQYLLLSSFSAKKPQKTRGLVNKLEGNC